MRPAPPADSASRLPLLAAGLLPLLVVSALTWPLVLHLGRWHMVTAWGDSHTWILDLTARHLLGGELGALVGKTAEAGYPVARDLRPVGGAALLVYLPLRLLLSPLGAGSLSHLLVFSATGLVTYGALGRLTGAAPWSRAFLSNAYALGPTVLSTLGMGELSNTQGWVFPAFLWLCAGACPLEDGRPARPLRALWAAPLALLCGLSSPYYSLALPLLAGGWSLVALLRRRLLLAPALLLGALLLGLLPVAAFYGGGASTGVDSLVQPAPRAMLGPPSGQALPEPPPVASPDSLVWPDRPDRLSPYQSQHVAYLGLPLVLAGLAASRRRGRGLGLSVLGLGVVLSLGPWLAFRGHYVQLAGMSLALPVSLLEALHYPTRQGGLYFRYATLAELGLVLLVARGLAGQRRELLLAGLLSAVHLADTLQATMPRWPLRVEPVADLDLLQAMAPVGAGGLAPDPMAADGAVLSLPLQGPTDGHFGQGSVLRALFHRRPTTGLLRDVRPHEDPAQKLLVEARRDPARFASRLSEAGFRYVLLPRELARFSAPDELALRALLGEPWHDGDLLVWDLGPTRLRLVEGAQPADPR